MDGCMSPVSLVCYTKVTVRLISNKNINDVMALVRDWLSERICYVEARGQVSAFVECNHGTIQGSLSSYQKRHIMEKHTQSLLQCSTSLINNNIANRNNITTTFIGDAT